MESPNFGAFRDLFSRHNYIKQVYTWTELLATLLLLARVTMLVLSSIKQAEIFR